MTQSLAGKTALVTGSGRNIGRAIALALGAAGANVVVNGHRDRSAVDNVVKEIAAAGGSAAGEMADVSKPDEIEAMVKAAAGRFGSVDIVVSNVALRPMRPFAEISLADWHDVLATNLSAGFHLARNAIPYMQRKKWGRLIFISGFDAFGGQVALRAHSVTGKAGTHGLAKALALEFAADGITVNLVAPGAIDTERDWSQYKHQPKEQVERRIPLGRYGDVNEIASACAFLASDAAGYVTGQALAVNGGLI